MGDEWKEQIIKAFPGLFKGNMLCIECDEGWSGIIDSFCQNVDYTLRDYPNAPDVTIELIKEKFGGLRIHIHANGMKNLFEIVDHYEQMSHKICERCGMLGKLRSHRPWHKTLCDSCDGKEDERVRKRMEEFLQRKKVN